jgi:hypothetical protein
MSAISGLPAVPDSALPASVRAGSTADRTAYKAALGFEQVPATELVEEMVQGTSSLAARPRADLVTDAMAGALESAGGLGLAPQLYTAIKQGSST